MYLKDDWGIKGDPITRDVSRESWEDFHNRALKQNIETYRASIKWFDKKKKVFKKSWAYRDGAWLKIHKEIKADLVFDKLSNAYSQENFMEKVHNFKGIKILNDPFFQSYFGSKLNQYYLLKNFMPKTYFVRDEQDLRSKLKYFKNKKIVIKPLLGSGGCGVKIGSKKELLANNYIYPVLIQKFIKSYGLPSIAPKNKTADLRVVVFNHHVLYIAARIAADGSDYTNVHQGAEPILIHHKNYPGSVLKIVNEIDKHFLNYEFAIYCLDFIFDRSRKPYLIEMNTKPGVNFLTMIGDENIRDRNLKEFIKVIEG